MNEPIDIEIVRTEALRKLGRNIVNFSKIEGCLKLLLTISRFEGDPVKISQQLEGKKEFLRKQSLGKLVHEFHRDIVGEGSEPTFTDDYTGPGISVSVSIHCSDPAFMKVRKRELSALVAERNKLIHQELAYLDTTSVDDYRRLICLLDEQNPRLLNHLEELGWILHATTKSWQTITQNWEEIEKPTKTS